MFMFLPVVGHGLSFPQCSTTVYVYATVSDAAIVIATHAVGREYD